MSTRRRIDLIDSIINEEISRRAAVKSQRNINYQPAFFYEGMQYAFNNDDIPEEYKNNKSFIDGYNRGKRLLSIYGSYEKIPDELLIVKPKRRS